MPRPLGCGTAPTASQRLLKWSLRLGSAVLFALAWELLAHRVDSLLLPAFSDTVAALIRLAATMHLWKAIAISNQALALGFSLAAILGILFGLAMARWRTMDQWSSPYITILLVTPVSAMIPILIMAAGLGLTARVVVIFCYAFVTIAVNTRTGVRTIDADWVEMSRAFGASERQLWRKTLFPGAAPAILTGLRLGLARAVTGMVTMELLFISVGVGRLLSEFQGRFEAADLYATVIVILAEAIVLMQMFQWLERRAVPWAASAVNE